MRFHHVGIETNKIDEAVQFYGKLGFRFETEIELLGERIVFLTLGLFRMELVLVDEKLKLTKNTHVAFEVENLDKMLDEHPELEIQEGPYSFENGWKAAFIQGPSGEIIELMQTN